MFNIPNLAHKLTVNPSTEYSNELNEAINVHNNSVASFLQNISYTAILRILFSKEIITEEEYAVELDRLLSMGGTTTVFEKNRDTLLECVAAEKEYLNDLKSMHDDMSTRIDPENDNA